MDVGGKLRQKGCHRGQGQSALVGGGFAEELSAHGHQLGDVANAGGGGKDGVKNLRGTHMYVCTQVCMLDGK